MSDDWRFFLCQMGDMRASVMVDVGIHDAIADTPSNLARLDLQYKHPDERGLPTQAEFDAVCKVEDQLESFVDQGKDAYVGRVTRGGERLFFVYTERSEASWEQFLRQLTADTGYEFGLHYSADPEHQGYWKDLYPTTDDWQVISDMDVVTNLQKHGDDPDAEHKIEHFSYFPDEISARRFIDWAVNDRFTHDPGNSGPREDGQFCVFLFHLGTTHQPDLSSHTIALNRKAIEFGGEYDGWGTEVQKAESAQ